MRTCTSRYHHVQHTQTEKSGTWGHAPLASSHSFRPLPRSFLIAISLRRLLLRCELHTIQGSLRGCILKHCSSLIIASDTLIYMPTAGDAGRIPLLFHHQPIKLHYVPMYQASFRNLWKFLIPYIAWSMTPLYSIESACPDHPGR